MFDAIAGTDHAARQMERFRAALAAALSPLFPDIAARCWALAREEQFRTVEQATRRHEVRTPHGTRQVVATAEGRRVVDVLLTGRTEVIVRPC